MAATLNAQPRENAGKGAARKLRAAGKVPAVLYGHGDANVPITVDAHELEKLLAGISIENTVFSLAVEGGVTTDVLIREVQGDPVRPIILHVDFLQLHAGETLTLQVPLHLAGTPAGVRDAGGVLDHVLYEIEVECLPRDIPATVDVDVSGMGVGESIRVRDLNLPNVKILTDGDLAIASVLSPTVRGTDEAAEGAESEGEA
ncbi:MAG TPA: 50S ribosomal protein L25 [Longimicrobiaceae bacterium]|jgi:large subunit ribosomal protein L25|nr:50S ribosomal protein L25 [Longimicrobiaceae bacterium]